MLIVDTIEQTQRVFIPRNGYTGSLEDLGFLVRNTTDHSVLDFVIHQAQLSGHYIFLVVGLPEAGFHAGEWEYVLSDAEGTAISHGLLMASPSNAPESIEYNTDTNCKQYGE